MATKKFYGAIGYGATAEIRPGVHDIVITEKNVYGDVVRNSRRLQEGEKISDDLSVGNSISIVADEYANEHFHAIQYVRWAGTLWKVSNVDVESPRLILRLGGVYNGPTADVTRQASIDPGQQ